MLDVHRLRHACTAIVPAALFIACQSVPTTPPQDDLVARGEQLFFNETFDGNGRTCGTCHRAEDNFGLSPDFIATLPPDDPLFIAENDEALARNFENPRLMRQLALIVENQDGFNDLGTNFNLRGVPHTLALRTSIESAAGPQTGWSGDGSPGDGSLRSFAVGAVIQHFPKTLDRVPGVDFRLPTDDELDALEAFQLSLGRQEELALPLPLKSALATRGQTIFMDRSSGKCNACHFNAGANADPAIFGPTAGNLNFDTGVEDLPDQPADLTPETVPPDDGLGTPGSGEFNTPVLVEAADTAPFFHNNSVESLELAVAFYNGNAFNNSPAGQLLQNATGSGIDLDATQVAAVSAFLRVINALENIRASVELLERVRDNVSMNDERQRQLLARAGFEIDDALQVLQFTGRDFDASSPLQSSADAVSDSVTARGTKRQRRIDDALRSLNDARERMVTP